MESKNICKFNSSRSSDLICTNFIFEANNGLSGTCRSDYHMLGLVTNGTGALRFGDLSVALQQGALFYVPRFEAYCVESAQELQYYYICFHGRRSDEYTTRLQLSKSRCVFPDHTELIPFWQNSHQLAEDGNIDMVCEAVLLYSLARLRPPKAQKHDVLTRILTLTQENFSDPGLSISAIASAIGYDAKYLSSLFKKKTGISYTRYLRDLRIRHAIFLMEEGLVSVKNIAILSGFQDPLYFSKVFTESEGISPKAYIDRLSSLRTGGHYGDTV